MKTEIIYELVALNNEFEKRWNRKVDYSGFSTINRENMLLCTLRRIVNTGESFLEGSKANHEIMLKYNERLMDEQGNFDFNTTDAVFEEKCPLCGNTVRYNKYDYSWEYKCDTPYCFESYFHGI